MRSAVTTQSNAMTRVYANVALSVLNSMCVAYLVSKSPAMIEFFLHGPMFWVILLAPLVMVFVFYAVLQNNESPFVAHALLHTFAGIMGIGLASAFLAYKPVLILTALSGTVVLFATMAVYGMVTKRNLDSLGGFLVVGLIALIVVGVINIFVGNSALDFALSGIGILIFLGFTAYDAQKIQELVSYDSNTNLEVLGALSLYLDFINLFLNLLKFMAALAADD